MRAQLAALLAELAPGDLNGDETADRGLHETGAEVEFGSDQERPGFFGRDYTSDSGLFLQVFCLLNSWFIMNVIFLK